jgi:hypothetical protein
VLLRGGRRGAVEAEDGFGLEFEVVDTEVFGVVAVISPGEGVDISAISAISAEGDSEDIFAISFKCVSYCMKI